MNTILLIFAFSQGAIWASFASVLAWRSGTNAQKYEDKKYQSIITGHSVCTHCGVRIPWWGLIPIFSYLSLHGQCHNCHKKISMLYPLMEFFTGIFTTLLTYQILHENISVYSYVFFLLIFFALLVMSYQDIWFGKIADKFAAPVIVMTFVVVVANAIFTTSYTNLVGILISSAVILFIFSSLVILTNAMGGGDLRAFILLTLSFSFPAILITLTISFIAASIGGLLQAFLTKNKKFLGMHVRLIPYLLLGFAIVAIWGNMLVNLIFYL